VKVLNQEQDALVSRCHKISILYRDSTKHECVMSTKHGRVKHPSVILQDCSPKNTLTTSKKCIAKLLGNICSFFVRFKCLERIRDSSKWATTL